MSVLVYIKFDVIVNAFNLTPESRRILNAIKDLFLTLLKWKIIML